MGRLFEISVLGHDHRGRGSQLQGEFLDAGNLGDHLSHSRGTGEGDLVDSAVCHELGADL